MIRDKPKFNKISSKINDQTQSIPENNSILISSVCGRQVDNQQNIQIYINQEYVDIKQQLTIKHLNTNAQRISFLNHQQTKQNCNTMLQPQSLPISACEIKKLNYEANCSNFLFCSAIPSPLVAKNKNISLQELEQKCDNFDILLFKNKSMLSKMQRLVTGSDYDHVAIVVKLQGCRYILEATGSHGVALSNFSKFINSLKQKVQAAKKITYQIGYRKFQSHKYSPQTLSTLQIKLTQFLSKVLGKKYKFNLMYLLSKEYQKQQQTFFCSQLIAQCLKYCGILQIKVPTYMILPRDFSSKCAIGNEDIDMEINASKQYKKQVQLLSQIYEPIKCVGYKTNKSIRI